MFYIIEDYSDKCLGTFEDLRDAELHLPYYQWLYEFEPGDVYVIDESGEIIA